MIQQLCNWYETKTHKYTQINTNKSTHSEMGPVWQNQIQRTVRTAHLSVLMTVHSFSTQYHAQNSSDNLRSYLQTNIIAQMQTPTHVTSHYDNDMSLHMTHDSRVATVDERCCTVLTAVTAHSIYTTCYMKLRHSHEFICAQMNVTII